ncbi:pentatricopeptide repeat-containing protein At2g17210 [Macadamia integrifolia]|uniref:pentatricopeptide repeat-containing protein At2g17210 n=1 Tax=Macadamia integrifolia TaxID=60698 RepID=UPI001C501F4F|nr:pentatricopeptide repeat-containing protein At2g17210 [Macadamia integrifolia]XP_042501071.1 pentatricopeptide repeat-containing protein At2g17210 [Macadamia integrifolia]
MRISANFSGSKFAINTVRIMESSSKGQWQEVLYNCHEMSAAGSLVDPSVFPPILKACTNLGCLTQGYSIHARLIKQGLESYPSIGNSTLDFYMKSEDMDSALGVFGSMRSKESVSWNIVIHGCLNQGAFEDGLWFFRQARVAGFQPNISTLVLVLQACRRLRALHEALIIHSFIIRSGFSDLISIQNSLLSVYVDFSDIESACCLFDRMPVRDVISWSAIIGGFVQFGEAHVAIGLFKEMFSLPHVQLDGLTVVNVLKACTSLGEIDLGRMLHVFVICRGFSSDLFIGNSLVGMYSKFNDSDSAFKIFCEVPHRNIVSWNSVLSGFVHNKRSSEAVILFSSMGEAGIEGDEVTLVTLLQAIKNLVHPLHCKSVHSTVLRKGYELNKLVLNSLMDAYAKCDMVDLGWKLFNRMTRRDMISWSTMISGFAHCGKPDKAMTIFQEMNQSQEKPNAVTMLSLLEACAVSADLRRSKWAHAIAIRRGLSTEVEVGTAILNVYSNCGEIDLSRRVFDHMLERNIVSWSAMLAAYGMNSRAHDALALLAEMELQGMKPNAITILSVLSACSHGGLIEQGLSCFEKMVQNHGFEPSLEHYSCVVDMLGRAGKLNSAMSIIKNMPEGVKAGASAWGALLSACRSYGNNELGRGAAVHVLELEPSNSAGYLLASNMYAAGGFWDNVARMRGLVKERDVKVMVGYSLVHLENKPHRFVAGDATHPQAGEIHALVEYLHGCMKMDSRIEILEDSFPC